MRRRSYGALQWNFLLRPPAAARLPTLEASRRHGSSSSVYATLLTRNYVTGLSVSSRCDIEKVAIEEEVTYNPGCFFHAGNSLLDSFF